MPGPDLKTKAGSGHELSEVLRDFAKTMVTDFPIEAILDHLVERIVSILPVSAAGVTLIGPSNSPRYIAASSDMALSYEKLQSDLAEGPCLVAYHTGKVVEVPDLREDDKFPKFAASAIDEGMRAVFAFPLAHGERRFGALDLYRDTPGSLDPEAMETARTLADVVAAYLLNAQARDDLTESSDRSRQASLHDPLTGLPNRVLLLERIEHALMRSARGGFAAVYFIDLDLFKSINDSHGHNVGDDLLIAVARRLAGLLRAHDTLARLAGDEFVAVCEDLDSIGQAATIGARMAASFDAPFTLQGAEVKISSSIGIAVNENNRQSPEEILHEADMAMYQAKHKGGGRQQMFDSREQNIADRQAGLARDLHHAIKKDQLYLEYQPIITTRDGLTSGFEALLRWRHPSHGIISPLVIIPLAERDHLITEIGLWVLHRAWEDRNRWSMNSATPGLTMAVNVSAHQLMTAGFTESVAKTVGASDADPALLTLEITESVFVQDSARGLIVLTALAELGVKIALDDFGTGYSSLNYLQQFPVDIIKIDKSFVGDIGRDRTSRSIVEAVVKLSHDLGMTVVAEGVETREQQEEVQRLGCDFGQGYFFARPMPVADVDKLYSEPTGVMSLSS